MVKKLKAMADKKAANPAGLLDSALAQTVKDSAQQIWLAGMGAFSKAQAEGTTAFEKLIKEGTSLQRKTQSAAEETIGAATAKMTAMAGEVGAKANAHWDKLEAIFDKFTQADSSTTRKYGGTGLGLSICRQLVELMSGRIGVLSKEGEGSTFWFELPLVEAVRSKPTASADGQYAAGTKRDFTVLVAEDNTINQKVARRFLEKLGCTVEIVENGEDAVARVRERVYDVVFMDCQMPKMDGYEATRAIRRLAEHANLPIIAMTAHAGQEVRERCALAGMDGYVTKPIQPTELFRALRDISQSQAAVTEVLSGGT